MEMEGEAGRPGLYAELAGDVGRRQNTCATWPPGSARAPRRGQPSDWMATPLTEWRPSSFDWQRDFNGDYLRKQLELAEGDNIKFVELREGYNFANWLKNRFGLDLKLHIPKVVPFETET
jgi:hypothetical protein